MLQLRTVRNFRSTVGTAKAGRKVCDRPVAVGIGDKSTPPALLLDALFRVLCHVCEHATLRCVPCRQAHDLRARPFPSLGSLVHALRFQSQRLHPVYHRGAHINSRSYLRLVQFLECVIDMVLFACRDLVVLDERLRRRRVELGVFREGCRQILFSLDLHVRDGGDFTLPFSPRSMFMPRNCWGESCMVSLNRARKTRKLLVNCCPPAHCPCRPSSSRQRTAGGDRRDAHRCIFYRSSMGRIPTV
eukprot:36016-Pleurochrysis_carterae.AAC.1